MVIYYPLSHVSLCRRCRRCSEFRDRDRECRIKIFGIRHVRIISSPRYLNNEQVQIFELHKHKTPFPTASTHNPRGSRYES